MSLITITDTIGCDAQAIARQVADSLTVELYDDSRLKEEALRMGLTTDHLMGFQEKAPDWFDHLLSRKPAMCQNLMESVIYEAACIGQGVIIGHGSQMLLHDFDCAMHVLVTANEESRIHRLMIEMNLSREAAQKLIRRSDNQKKKFFRFAFHKDWNDPSLYDLYVNPDKIGSDKAAQLIMQMARSPELDSCSVYTLDALGRMSQTKRIEAALMEMDLRHSALKVETPVKGFAHITGVLYNHEDKGRIPTVVGKIPGVEKVQLDVTVVPVGYD